VCTRWIVDPKKRVRATPQLHTGPNMSQAENITYPTIKGNKFVYDGESHTINGYPKSSPAAISEELRR
jgi:hypothetical protein